ncbi:BON domain-containing protein, partial [Alphaproteobacteria bacterium]|nr:BON domain-containing protein [Alphaproteobacteria bacterium]
TKVVLLFVTAAGLIPTLVGCTGIVISAGSTIASAAVEERGISGAASDLAIATAITALWIKHDPSLVTDFDTAISEGRVLLTGTVATQKRRLEAVRLAWRAPGVKTIINEIDVRKSDGIGGYARDGWITAQLVSRLSFDRGVNYINYNLETVNQIVYLLGIAQNQTEMDRVVTHARQVRYVRRVVSHIRLKNDPRRKLKRKTLSKPGQRVRAY